MSAPTLDDLRHIARELSSLGAPGARASVLLDDPEAYARFVALGARTHIVERASATEGPFPSAELEVDGVLFKAFGARTIEERAAACAAKYPRGGDLVATVCGACLRTPCACGCASCGSDACGGECATI